VLQQVQLVRLYRCAYRFARREQSHKMVQNCNCTCTSKNPIYRLLRDHCEPDNDFPYLLDRKYPFQNVHLASSHLGDVQYMLFGDFNLGFTPGNLAIGQTCRDTYLRGHRRFPEMTLFKIVNLFHIGVIYFTHLRRI
jgi:hypothetical protein